MLKVERNNAMDELAMAQAGIQRLGTKEELRSEYWKSWAAGDIEKAAWWDRLWRSLPHRLHE